MRSHTEYLTFEVRARMAFQNITPEVEAAVKKSGVREGLVLVNAMHITASVFINDDEAGLHHDYAAWLEELAPFDASPQRYRHNRTGEDNADAHMKRQVMGREVVVAITDGFAHNLAALGARQTWRRRYAPLRVPSSTSARGSRSSTASSTAGGRSEC